MKRLLPLLFMLLCAFSTRAQFTSPQSVMAIWGKSGEDVRRQVLASPGWSLFKDNKAEAGVGADKPRLIMFTSLDRLTYFGVVFHQQGADQAFMHFRVDNVYTSPYRNWVMNLPSAQEGEWYDAASQTLIERTYNGNTIEFRLDYLPDELGSK